MKKKQEILLNALSTIVFREIERQNLKKSTFCYENDISTSKFYGLINATRDVGGTTLIFILLLLRFDMGELGKELWEILPEDILEIAE